MNGLGLNGFSLRLRQIGLLHLLSKQDFGHVIHVALAQLNLIDAIDGLGSRLARLRCRATVILQSCVVGRVVALLDELAGDG